MKNIIIKLGIITFVFLVYNMDGQERNKTLVKSIESTNPEQYKSEKEALKATNSDQKIVNNQNVLKSIDSKSSGDINSKTEVNAESLKTNATTSTDEKSVSSTKPAPSISNSSAIANGQSNSNSPAVARVLKYKADEKSVEYYNQLREKFEAEEKIRLEKEAADKIINAKKEEEARQARHLTDEQAPQFDKYRNGETNPVEKKTTVEEDYNKLFK